MGYVKAIIAMGTILVSGYYYHKYEDKHNCMEIWRGLLWFALTIGFAILVAFIPTE